MKQLHSLNVTKIKDISKTDYNIKTKLGLKISKGDVNLRKQN